MKFYWFGDSWVYGDELDQVVGAAQREKHTFATLVSQHFQAECINLGALGSSVPLLLLKFHQIVNEINPATDRIFFFLTANH